MAKRKMNFEQSLSRLESIVELMEDPETGIDDMVNHFKEAVELGVSLNESLTAYEQKVTELMGTAGGFAEKPFDEV